MQLQPDQGRSTRVFTTGRGAPLPGVLALAVVLGGCLELDLPTVPDGGVPPSLTVLVPQPGDTLTLNSVVSLAAESVGGAPTVTLSCGPTGGSAPQLVQIYAWAGPPYAAVVDFTRCEKLAATLPDGGAGSLVLQAEAINPVGGAKSQKSVTVHLDATSASLAVEYPPSVQPLSPLDVRVIPLDRPLAAFPEVALEGTPADSVTIYTLVDGGIGYLASFRTTPGLGIDQYTGPPPVPIEVLTETSRTALITIDAKAQNGNPTHLDRSVELSRVVWDRSIPGRPLVSVNSPLIPEPAAVLEGLVLPLATDDLTPTVTSRWIPGLMAAADGVYSPFDPNILPGGLDGGFLATGINALGQTLFSSGIRTFTEVLFAPLPGTGGGVTPSTFPTTMVTPLTRVDDRLCLPDVVSGTSQTGCFNTDSLLCIAPDLSRPTLAGTSGPVVGFNSPATGAVAGAGGTYLAPTGAGCEMAWAVGSFGTGSFTFQSRNDPDPNAASRSCTFQTVNRVLPVGDGSVVVAVTSFCAKSGSNEFPILRVAPGGAIVGSYVVARGAPSPTQPIVIAALAGGRVVTLENQPPYSVFKLWSMGKTSPDAVALVAGLYEYDDSTPLPSLGRNVVAISDGSFAVLLSGAPLGVGVLGFGPGLTPRWFYLYPRLTTPATQRLFGSPQRGEVYLVDGTNNRVAALELVAPDGGSGGSGGGGTGGDGGPGPDGGAPDGGAPDSGTPDAGVVDAG